MGVGGSLDSFHRLVDLSLSTHMSAKLFRLNNVRSCVFAFLKNYMLNERSLLQFNTSFLYWLYQQVLMYDLPLTTFKKYFRAASRMFLYAGYSHIYSSPFYFLLKHIEDPKDRMEYYKGKIKAKDGKSANRELMSYSFFITRKTGRERP